MGSERKMVRGWIEECAEGSHIDVSALLRSALLR